MSEAVIRLRDLSKWYGEVLGLARVSLDVSAGITCLVGPNGSGKSTLMGLVSGLLRPSLGTVEVLGIPPSAPERLHRVLGTCTQHDSFPPGFRVRELLDALLRVAGLPRERSAGLSADLLARVGLADAAERRIEACSKGMKQRLKLALALAHDPRVLLLDEPLNGLDPLGRSELLALFRSLAREGRTLVVSSHVLHEVDAVADGVVMLHHGYVVAEGGIAQVRSEIRDKPYAVRVACSRPARLAALAFETAGILSARVEGSSLVAETFDMPRLCALVQDAAARGEVDVEGIDLADENVQAVYDYLIRGEEAPR